MVFDSQIGVGILFSLGKKSNCVVVTLCKCVSGLDRYLCENTFGWLRVKTGGLFGEIQRHVCDVVQLHAVLLYRVCDHSRQ
jgi:hypothetical protein